MFPGIFEWVWDPGHLIFFGIFWAVITVMLSGIIMVLGKSLRDLKREARDTEDAWVGLTTKSGE